MGRGGYGIVALNGRLTNCVFESTLMYQFIPCVKSILYQYPHPSLFSPVPDKLQLSGWLHGTGTDSLSHCDHFIYMKQIMTYRVWKPVCLSFLKFGFRKCMLTPTCVCVCVYVCRPMSIIDVITPLYKHYCTMRLRWKHPLRYCFYIRSPQKRRQIEKRKKTYSLFSGNWLSSLHFVPNR